MKSTLNVSILALAILLGCGMIALLRAQSTYMAWTVPAASTAGCGTSPSTSVPAGMCLTVNGLYTSLDGGKTWQGPYLTSAPVTSVFGRTGAVVAAPNDYNFSQLSGQVAGKQLAPATCTYTSNGISNVGAILNSNNCQ